MSEINQEQLNSGQERRERQAQKKADRESEIAQARQKRTLKKIGYWVLGVVIVLGGGWRLVSTTGPKGQDFSQAYPILGRNHVADGAAVVYNSNPPTSGEHYAVVAPVRFYDRELPDEQLVHNLEHGHIWISHKPDLPKKVVDTLKDLSGGNVVVTQRSKNDTDIALAAWGRLDKFNIEGDSVDEQRIKDFISRYQNRGPERVNMSKTI